MVLSLGIRTVLKIIRSFLLLLWVLGTCALVEPLVIDVSNVNLSDHASWNGDDCADVDFIDDLVNVDSPCSMPARWDYDRVDDAVWDFDPSMLKMDEVVEADSLVTLEYSSVNLEYCSSVLKSIEAEDSDEDEDMDKYEADGDEVEAPGSDICAQVSNTKRRLLSSLDMAVSQDSTLAPKKTQRGPIIAPRMNTRNHGNQTSWRKLKNIRK